MLLLSLRRFHHSTSLKLLSWTTAQPNTVPFLHERYAAEIAEGRLRVVEEEQNSGAAGAKNRGVEEARGEWI